MNTPINWNASISAQTPALLAKWGEVRRGLRRVLLGYWLLLLLGVPGLYIVWLAQAEPARWPFEAKHGLNPMLGLVVGGVLAGLGAVLWYWLLFTGQWLCLSYAPQRHAAKELLFCCFFCLLIGPAAIGAGHLLRGEESYQAVAEGLLSLKPQTLLQPGTIAQLAGVMICLANLLLFTGFLRAIMKCLNPADSSLLANFYWFVAFLAGATVGLFAAAGSEILAGLAIGWASCLGWHMLLISTASRQAHRVLHPHPDKGRVDSKHRPKPPSGLRAVYVRLRSQQ